MSATRDKSQKVAFVYSNFYQLYKKGKEAAVSADVQPRTGQSSAVIKVEDLHSNIAQIKVRSYTPPELLTKRIVGTPVQPTAVPNPAIQGLKDNLKNLNDLHARLRFMLKELEDLIKE